MSALASIVILGGVLAAVPGSQGAVFALGLGLIVIAKNVVRCLARLRPRRVGWVVGAGAVAAGLTSLAAPRLPIFAIFMVTIGIALLGVALGEILRGRRPPGHEARGA